MSIGGAGGWRRIDIGRDGWVLIEVAGDWDAALIFRRAMDFCAKTRKSASCFSMAGGTGLDTSTTLLPPQQQ
jgi:hypothetical protein